jgi:hypothetical protein
VEFHSSKSIAQAREIAHNNHPTGLSHQYYVDGPISVAGFWLGPGTDESKTYSE